MVRSENEADRGPEIPPNLRAALESARRGHRASFETLRTAVSDYVRDLRARKMSDGDVQLAVQAVFDARVGATADPSWDAKLVAIMLEWCERKARH
jgi:hypothetical protein